MHRLKIVTRIESISLTADDWQLFTHDVELADRCAAAVKKLNGTLVACVNAGMTRAEVERHVGAVMSEYSDAGAADSEPYHTLDDVLDEIFRTGE